MKRLKDIISGIYIGLISLLLYAPILMLIVLSFNNSRSRVTWGGFTLNWYYTLFSNKQILDALGATVVLALASSMIAVLVGVPGAIGINDDAYQHSDAQCRYRDRYSFDVMVCAFYTAWVRKRSFGPYNV